jgi:hypothetical protein
MSSHVLPGPSRRAAGLREAPEIYRRAAAVKSSRPGPSADTQAATSDTDGCLDASFESVLLSRIGALEKIVHALHGQIDQLTKHLGSGGVRASPERAREADSATTKEKRPAGHLQPSAPATPPAEGLRCGDASRLGLDASAISTATRESDATHVWDIWGGHPDAVQEVSLTRRLSPEKHDMRPVASLRLLDAPIVRPSPKSLSRVPTDGVRGVVAAVPGTLRNPSTAVEPPRAQRQQQATGRGAAEAPLDVSAQFFSSGRSGSSKTHSSHRDHSPHPATHEVTLASGDAKLKAASGPIDEVGLGSPRRSEGEDAETEESSNFFKRFRRPRAVAGTLPIFLASDKSITSEAPRQQPGGRALAPGPQGSEPQTTEQLKVQEERQRHLDGETKKKTLPNPSAVRPALKASAPAASPQKVLATPSCQPSVSGRAVVVGQLGSSTQAPPKSRTGKEGEEVASAPTAADAAAPLEVPKAVSLPHHRVRSLSPRTTGTAEKKPRRQPQPITAVTADALRLVETEIYSPLISQSAPPWEAGVIVGPADLKKEEDERRGVSPATTIEFEVENEQGQRLSGAGAEKEGEMEDTLTNISNVSLDLRDDDEG